MNKTHGEGRYADIAVGDRASFAVAITPELVRRFAEISGDMNPLHMDEQYAQGTSFGQRVAHGMLVGSFFSRLVGMHLPGKYSLYLSQSMHFHAPVLIGAEIAVSGEVIHKSDAVRTVTVHMMAEDVHSKNLLVSGDAMVKLLE
jgi:acyl dehydratase